MKSRLKRTLLLLTLTGSVCVWSSASTDCRASEKRPRKGKEVVAAKQPVAVKQNPYQRLFSGKKTESARGMLTLHMTDGKLYVEIPRSLLNRDMLISTCISETSDNRFGNVGEITTRPLMVAFTLVDSTIRLINRENCHYKTDDPNIAQRLSISMQSPIMEKYPVLAWGPDSSAVIEMTRMFTEDNDNLDPFSPYSDASAGGQRQIDKQFNRDKSSLDGIKAFDDNVSIRSTLSYMAGTRPGPREPRPFINKKPFTVTVTRSINLLPETPMMARLADPRVGIFMEQSLLFDQIKGTQPLFQTLRWRLEPSDRTAYERGELVEPIKPIVYYVDDKFPEWWKPYIKAGVEEWQKAFEKIGFKNAIIARDFPTNDPQFDPDNFKYSCIRYCPVAVANAMGMPMSDPRSGEILNARVYVFHNVVELLQAWRFIQTAPADKDVRKVDLPREIMGDCIRYLVSHEVGHTLSLMHNMAGSSSIPVDSLRSPSFTQRYGTTYSIMDYARNNYVAQPGDKERGVRLTPPAIGEYDYFAIKWLYQPVPGATTSQQEIPVLRQWIAEKSNDPVFRYGKQQIRSRLDPSSVEEDLGNDPVLAAQYGVKNLKYILKHLDEWVSDSDPNYEFRQRIYNEAISQFMRYMNHVGGMIGGIYLNERYEGDARESYRAVAAKDQRRAVAFILEQISDLQWLNSSNLDRGYPLSGNISGQLEASLINGLLRSFGAVAICESKTQSNPFTRQQLLDQFYAFFMKPTLESRTLTPTQMALQMRFIDAVIEGSAASRKGIMGGDVAVSAQQMLTLFALPESILQNSRADYGDIPESMAGVFTNRTIPSTQTISYTQSDYSGFNEPALRSAGYPMEYNFMATLQQIRTLLNSRLNTGSQATRDYYRMILFKLDRALK